MTADDSSLSRPMAVLRPNLLLPDIRQAFAPACLALCLIIGLLPLLLHTTPPFFDYPNHLARAHIMAHWGEAEAFRNVFTIDSLLVPNVLADIVTAGLAMVMDTMTAGRVLLGLIVALMLTGAFALNAAAVGQATVWPLFAALFLYNEMLFWGFLNYLLGLGLLLWGCAAWLHFAERSRARQLASGTVFGILIFLSHLVAFGLFGVAIALIELHRAWVHRRDGWPVFGRLAVSAAIFLPSLALFLARSPSRGLPMDVRFHFDMFLKLSPLTRVLSSGNVVLDVAVLAAAVVVPLFLLVRGRLGVEPRLAMIAGTFLVMVLVLPYTAMESYFLDSRIAVAAFIMAACMLRPRKIAWNATRWVAALVIALITVRSMALAADWREGDRFHADLSAGLEQVPRGSLLLPASATHFEFAANWFETRTIHPPHEHAANYATILRGAVVTNIFAKQGQNPLVFTPESPAVRRLVVNPIHRAFRDEDLAFLVDGLRAVVAGDDPVFGGKPAYLIVFNRTCADWPASVVVTPAYCGQNFALMAVTGPQSPVQLEVRSLRDPQPKRGDDDAG